MAKSHQPRPVYDWELPKLAAAQSETNASEATDGDDDMDGVF
jgi:hypothetical protein